MADEQRSAREAAATPRNAGRQGPASAGLFRVARCKFCMDKIDYIDYKDVRTLAPFVPDRGKILCGDFRRVRPASAQAADGNQARAAACALIPCVTD
jgi:small subunit ribosomal protein S18